MKRLYPSVLCLFIIPVFIYSHIPEPRIKLYVSHFENVLGTSFELKVSAESEALADDAEAIALGEIDRLAGILSAYDSASEFSRWNRSSGQPVKISAELFTVLSLFDQWKVKSGGALDASAEAVSRVWKNAARINQLPSQQDISQALEEVNRQHWILNKTNGTAIRTGHSPLMMNSFVKSYIIRRVAEKITAQQGIHGTMVNIGGDIVIVGDIQENIRISDPKADAENDVPLAVINVQNKAIATSGNYRRGFNIGGKWFSHIVDPRTGIPADQVISATVVSPNATDAGAMATAFNVLDVSESQKLAATIPGTEYLIVTKTGEHYSSEGWNNIEIANNPTITAKTSLQTDYELLINLELAQFEGRFRRPFVAIWVQNTNKKTVRNLALWFNKPRWLPDLKEWYRTNYQDITGSGKNVESISSATRPPGKYTIKWDMKDDAGNLVPAGKYTVYIEAAREHGTYQLIRKEIDCRKKEQSVSLPGNAEISSASLEYRKAGAN
jgi:thiamine biosynthesis lipoprotein